MNINKRLNNAALSAIQARGIHTPSYDRSDLLCGVVHLGLGAFHRAHQAMVFDSLLAKGDPRWAVLGVAMNSTTVADALAAQDGLYAVHVASKLSMQWHVPGAILATAVASRERHTVVNAIAAAHTRWITLTVTEKGYTESLASLIVQGLALRHAQGHSGLTIASCDNLSENGRKLQALCLNAAKSKDEALATWINTQCKFPCSMVDRIVPAATPDRTRAAREALGVATEAALGTEGFWEWVLEDNLADPSDAVLLRSAGVNVVRDVRPFEEAKLRMLNGSHSAMAVIGAVAGLAMIADCINEPAIRHMMQGFMTHEVAPHISRPDWQAYREALVERWANLDLKHSVHQIAMDSSQKIPQRWPPCIIGQINNGKPFERFAFSAAAFMRYCSGVNEQGVAYTIQDPMAAQLQALAQQHAGDVKATVQALGSIESIWGAALPQNTPWLARVAHWLGTIRAQGILQAAALLPAENSP